MDRPSRCQASHCRAHVVRAPQDQQRHRQLLTRHPVFQVNRHQTWPWSRFFSYMGLTWVHLGPPRSTWVHLGPPGSIRSTWVHKGPRGSTWVTWVHQGPPGSTWVQVCHGKVNTLDRRPKLSKNLKNFQKSQFFQKFENVLKI